MRRRDWGDDADALMIDYVQLELPLYDDVFHGWQMHDGMVPEARQSLEQAARFMRTSATADHRSPVTDP